jgi:hypothetical protein
MLRGNHISMLLQAPHSSEYYFILAIFGLEFALNLGGPEVDGYLAWLNCHEGASPLYWGKSAG